MSKSNQKKVIIIGAGGHGKVAKNILTYKKEYRVIGFLDDNKKGKSVFGKLSDFEKYLKGNLFFIAIGNNKIRAKVYNLISSKNGKFVNAIHPNSYVENSVVIGENVMIGAFSYINIDSKVSDNTIINNGCIVEHHNTIGKHCHLAPGVVTAGDVTIEDFVWVGLGTTIKEGLRIGKNSFIGAHSNVVKDIKKDYLYYGNPAKLIKKSPYASI